MVQSYHIVIIPLDMVERKQFLKSTKDARFLVWNEYWCLEFVERPHLNASKRRTISTRTWKILIQVLIDDLNRTFTSF